MVPKPPAGGSGGGRGLRKLPVSCFLRLSHPCSPPRCSCSVFGMGYELRRRHRLRLRKERETRQGESEHGMHSSYTVRCGACPFLKSTASSLDVAEGWHQQLAHQSALPSLGPCRTPHQGMSQPLSVTSSGVGLVSAVRFRIVCL